MPKQIGPINLSAQVDKTRVTLSDQSHPHEQRARFILAQTQGTSGIIKQPEERPAGSTSTRVEFREQPTLPQERQGSGLVITKRSSSLSMPKLRGNREGSLMSVDMTPSQKEDFERYLRDRAKGSDSDDESDSARAVEQCPYGC